MVNSDYPSLICEQADDPIVIDRDLGFEMLLGETRMPWPCGWWIQA